MEMYKCMSVHTWDLALSLRSKTLKSNCMGVREVTDVLSVVGWPLWSVLGCFCFQVCPRLALAGLVTLYKYTSLCSAAPGCFALSAVEKKLSLVLLLYHGPTLLIPSVTKGHPTGYLSCK